MNSKHLMFAITCAAATLCGSVRAQSTEASAEEKATGWNWAMGEGLTLGETPIVSTEVSLAFDSKYLSYGLVDNNDPILTPAAAMTCFDWLTFSVAAIFDTTRYGAKHVDGEKLYENRQFKYQELDPGVSLDHSFSQEDFEWLPTTVEFSLGYMYEYHPRSYAVGQDDTQFLTFEVSLPELWLEPTLAYERDIDRDNGTYLNLELGHTFELCECLTLRPSIAQGFGNTQRTAGYLAKEDGSALRHGGLMDTLVKAELAWKLAPGVTLAGYVGYSDFLFDRKIREAARSYEASGDWDDSWNVIAGLSLALTF